MRKKDSPTGERMVVKPYPKDNEPRVLRITASLAQLLADRIADLHLAPDDLVFPSTADSPQVPISRGTFRARAWIPAAQRAGLAGVRIHDLRHAHASWLLAGGADL